MINAVETMAVGEFAMILMFGVGILVFSVMIIDLVFHMSEKMERQNEKKVGK